MRKSSNADSTLGVHGVHRDPNSHKVTIERETSSDVESELSKRSSRLGDDNFSKTAVKADQKEVVQELDDEDNVSEQLSNRKIQRRKSIRRRNSITKLQRRNSIRKSQAGLARLLGNNKNSEGNESFIKLQKAEIVKPAQNRSYSPSRYMKVKSKSPNKTRKPGKKLFYYLHDKKFLSSLGKKVAKPEIPQSLYPQVRVN